MAKAALNKAPVNGTSANGTEQAGANNGSPDLQQDGAANQRHGADDAEEQQILAQLDAGSSKDLPSGADISEHLGLPKLNQQLFPDTAAGQKAAVVYAASLPPRLLMVLYSS